MTLIAAIMLDRYKFSALIFVPAVMIGFILRSLGLLSAFKRVGNGNIGADKSYLLITSTSFYAFSLVSIGFSLVGDFAVPLAYLFSGCIGYQIEKNRNREAYLRLISSSRPKEINNWKYYHDPKGLWYQYASLLIISLAGFLVTNGDALTVSWILGSETLASYAVGHKLALGLFGLAAIYPSMQLQPITKSFSSGDFILSRRFWLEGVAVALSLAVTMAVCLYTIYPNIAEWTTGRNNLLDRKVFILLCISAVLMSLTAACGWAIIGANGPKSVLFPTLIDASLTLVLGAIGASSFGIFGLLYGIIFAHTVSAGMHSAIAYKLFYKK